MNKDFSIYYECARRPTKDLIYKTYHSVFIEDMFYKKRDTIRNKLAKYYSTYGNNGIIRIPDDEKQVYYNFMKQLIKDYVMRDINNEL